MVVVVLVVGMISKTVVVAVLVANFVNRVWSKMVVATLAVLVLVVVAVSVKVSVSVFVLVTVVVVGTVVVPVTVFKAMMVLNIVDLIVDVFAVG